MSMNIQGLELSECLSVLVNQDPVQVQAGALNYRPLFLPSWSLSFRSIGNGHLSPITLKRSLVVYFLPGCFKASARHQPGESPRCRCRVPPARIRLLSPVGTN